MNNATLVSRTQRIIMNTATGSISVINAGPPGPPGSAGTDQHIVDVIAAALSEGSGIAIDSATTPGEINITNTGAVTSYGDENVRDVLASTIIPATDEIAVTNDDPGNTYTIGLASTFKDRILKLEQAKAILQYKDNIDATGGTPVMNINGTNNYVSTPSNAAYDFAGQFNVIARIKMPSTVPGATWTIAARYGASTAAGQWRFLITTAGQMQITVVNTGGVADTSTTTAAVPLAYDGNWIWVRIDHTTDGLTDFYTGVDDGTNTIPASWTSFQANRAMTSGSPSTTSGAPLTIGAYNAGASSPFTGQIGRVVVYSGTIAGTVVADANASDWTSGTTWVGPASRTWTLNGTASITGGGATGFSNTTSPFDLVTTDAFTGVAVTKGTTLLVSAAGTWINTSGSTITHTPKIQVNGVDIFTFPAISVPSVAANRPYRWELELKVEVNKPDGTKQICQANFVVYADASSGDDLGSAVMTAPLSGTPLGGYRAGALTTFTSVPAMKLIDQMSAASTGAQARPGLTQLALLAA